MSERKARQEEQSEARETGEPPRSLTSRVERKSHTPAYVASIGDGQYNSTFDDFLELALQAGVVTMFAGAFPLVALFALVEEPDADSERPVQARVHHVPVPHAVASIGALLDIFQAIIRQRNWRTLRTYQGRLSQEDMMDSIVDMLYKRISKGKGKE